MTVGELIEELRRMPAHIDVVIEGGPRLVDRVELGKCTLGLLPQNVARIFPQRKRDERRAPAANYILSTK